MRLCVVSPHLDDAVLSCGIRMQRCVAENTHVVVLNIFSAGLETTTLDAHAGTNPARRIEDKAAIDLLSADVAYLDELDAPDRDARYKSDINLFHGDMAHVPAGYIPHIAKRLADFFAAHKIDTAFFPLGAGTHIDHRITFAAGRLLEQQGHPVDIHYYEDRPYILWPGVLQGRLYALDTNATLPAINADQMMAAIHDYHYLRHFVPPGAFRNQCLPFYFKPLEKPQAPKLHVTESSLTATQDELDKLWQSLAHYTSQMPFIYPDKKTFISDSQRYEAIRSDSLDYIERSWKFNG
jgi:LmbE family N-acetylglucosaminyl deacetylase